MFELELMKYKDELKIRREADKRLIFDPIRKKWLVLQPEEVVRQLVVQFLIQEKGYNKNRINIEKGLTVNDLSKRCDILVYDQQLAPFLLVECKAPHVDITQDVFKQIAWYNMPLKVNYLLVTNGVASFCCVMDYERQSYEFLDHVPDFPRK